MKALAFNLVGLLVFSTPIIAQPPVEKELTEQDSMRADMTHSSAKAYEKGKRGDKKRNIDKSQLPKNKNERKKNDIKQ